jgi:NADH-quinone oxidoreductase subunit J
MEQFLFFFIALVAVASAVYFVFARNPLYAILSLIVTFFSIAALYVLLNAQFLGIVQIIVYTGAIMVLFLYVLMMLNLNAKDESKKQNLTKFIGIFSAGILFVGMLGAYKGLSQSNVVDNIDSSIGLTKNLGKLLFNEYVLPFELASILIYRIMEVNSFLQNIPLNWYIILSTTLFCLGVLGVLVRKNAIIILGCVELMLNSVNLLLAAFSAYKGDGHGQILVFFIMVVAAAEVAVGLAIITMMYRNTRNVDVSIFNKLKG